MKWYTSDLHFCHKKILHYQKQRKYNSVDEMDASYVAHWRKMIAPEDTIYILGDFALGSATKMKAILSQLPGHKVLVYGNHDYKSESWYLNAGFESLLKPNTIMNIGGIDVRTSHFPYRPSILKAIWYALFDRKMLRYFFKMKCNDGMPLLHGHVHDKWKIKGNMINVGIDAWGRPLSEEEIYVGLCILGYEKTTYSATATVGN